MTFKEWLKNAGYKGLEEQISFIDMEVSYNAGIKEGITRLRNALVDNAQSKTVAIWVDKKAKEIKP